MTPLYLVSSESYTGKTLACLVLARRYRQQGLSAGYFKPLGRVARQVGERWVDQDVHLVLQALELADPPEQVCPLLPTPALVAKLLAGHRPEADRLIREAYHELAARYQVMLVSGTGAALCHGSMLGITAPEIADLLEARVLLVQKAHDTLCADPVLACAERFGRRLVGVVFNGVPPELMAQLDQDIRRFLQRAGIPVLGILPRERTLSAVSARELAERLGAQVLSGEERLDNLVEHVVVGAMSADRALPYFRRDRPAVLVTPGERTDLQLTALAATTRALVLTGQHPQRLVLERAQAAGVPVMLSAEDIFATVASVEEVLGKPHMCAPAQVAKAADLYQERVDLAAIDAAIGL